MKEMWAEWKWFVVVGLATLGLFLVAGWASGWDRAALPGWLEAIATLSAFTAAGFAVIQVSRTLAIERRRDDERSAQQHREQARLVYAVPKGKPRKMSLNDSVEGKRLDVWAWVPSNLIAKEPTLGIWVAVEDISIQKVEIGNLSRELISQVQVFILLGGELFDGGAVLSHVVPGERVVVDVPTRRLPTSDDPDVQPLIEVRLMFHDSGGYSWFRDGYGPAVDWTH